MTNQTGNNYQQLRVAILSLPGIYFLLCAGQMSKIDIKRRKPGGFMQKIETEALSA